MYRITSCSIIWICCILELGAGAIHKPFVRDINGSSYFSKREALQDQGSSLMLGHDIILSSDEEIVNGLLMKNKNAEYSATFGTANFSLATNFFKNKQQIDESLVFKFIQQMPKGSALHIHDSASASIDWVISNLTYWDNLYICNITEDEIRFKFFMNNSSNNVCDWQLVSDVRASYSTNQEFDDYLHEQLSLFTPFPEVKYPNINIVWTHFQKIFSTLHGILTYTEARKAQIHQSLTELMQDNVIYCETRGIAPLLYELDGTKLTREETVGVFKEAVDNFMLDNYPSFYGSKFIYSTLRFKAEKEIEQYIDMMIKLKDLYPDYVLGFDLVGQEDLGTTLVELINPLLRLAEHEPTIPVFYHAGETNWYGTTADDNLYDAILLNSTRIGHGYGINKHPALMQEAISKNIPIEVCPLSNQILMLVDDLRNHPAVGLAAQSFPLIISSDDPGIWDALPLSHDFYAAFMAFGGARADLKFLKKLALNSIEYTALNIEQKKELMILWQKQWTNFIADQVAYSVPDSTESVSYDDIELKS